LPAPSNAVPEEGVTGFTVLGETRCCLRAATSQSTSGDGDMPTAVPPLML
jgi:hypothetical protein